MMSVLKSVLFFVMALWLMTVGAFAQSSLPLTAGKVLVNRIDVASSKKIRLPEGRWIVMGLHTGNTPLTGGSKNSQDVEHLTLMNEDANAPIQFLALSWTLYADVNWTSQHCDSLDSVKNRPFKDTLGTNTSSLVIKCSASHFNQGFGGFLAKNFESETPIRKSLWLPISQNSRE